MSTHVQESTIIEAPLQTVWEHVKNLDFKFLSTVSKVEYDATKPTEVGGTRKVHYKDGTVQVLHLLSYSELQNRIGWDVVQSEPAVDVMSVTHNIHLRRITTTNGTFVEFNSHFSKDASYAVLEDSKFKKREMFRALRKAVVQTESDKKNKEMPKLVRQVSERTQALRAVFQQLDKNKSGFLEFEEFSQAVQSLVGKELPDMALRVMLLQADQDGDGLINYDEFAAFLDTQKA